MADSSSTSSSERSQLPETGIRRDDRRAHGLPWALLMAITLLALAEMGVRQMNPTSLIVSRDDSDQARAVRDVISLDEPFDVAFLGSSMMYQGINVPDLQAKLRNATGQETRVRNFAVRGGRMDVFAATVRHLLRQENKPRLFVIGTSIRDLRDYDLDLDRLSLFWNVQDFRTITRERGYRATKYLPTVIRNEIEPHFSLLKYRNALSLQIERLFVRVNSEPMPVLGKSPSQHLGSKRDEVLTLDEFKSSSNKRRMAQAYRVDLPPQPSETFTRCIDQIIDDCRKADVKVIFLDMPINRLMRGLIINADKKHKSDQIEPAYRAAMAEHCTARGVAFLTSEDLGLTWEDNEFFDSQHLNYAGAVKLGDALLPAISKELAK